MGLDAVEIVMAVEEAFDIQIENSEAEKILTPGQLIDLTMSKAPLTNSSACLTHRSFNLLRHFLLGQGTLTRRQIAPRTPLEELLPRQQRSAAISQLSALLAIPSLTLVRADWLKAMIFGIAVLCGLSVAIAFPNFGIPTWLPGLLTVALTCYLGALATQSYRTDFPKPISTVGDLSRWIMTHKSDLAVAETKAWTREQVATRVRDIVIEQLGCEKIYREDALFVNDLGLD